MQCQACTHRRAYDLETELLKGTSYSTIAMHFALTKSAISRHARNCMGMSRDLNGNALVSGNRTATRNMCLVCTHDGIYHIESLLLDGDLSYDAIGNLYDFGGSSVQHHAYRCMGMRRTTTGEIVEEGGRTVEDDDVEYAELKVRRPWRKMTEEEQFEAIGEELAEFRKERGLE